MSDYGTLYIIILNYNNYQLTKECVGSLLSTEYINKKIIIVDDYSAERDIEKITTDYPEVRLINNKKNLSYCKSFNVGIRIALKESADYVFLINNDTKSFSKEYFNKILPHFNNDARVGMIGSKCIDYVGGVRRDENPSIRFGITMDTPTEGYVIKREVFETIGLLNEKLVIYMEDLDFIQRLRDAGFITKIETSVSFAHLGGGTTSKVVFRSNFYRVRNVILFTRKYCQNFSFAWRLKEILGNLKVHFSKLGTAVTSFKIKKAIKIFAAISAGIVLGSTISLSSIWSKDLKES